MQNKHKKHHPWPIVPTHMQPGQNAAAKHQQPQHHHSKGHQAPSTGQKRKGRVDGDAAPASKKARATYTEQHDRSAQQQHHSKQINRQQKQQTAVRTKQQQPGSQDMSKPQHKQQEKQQQQQWQHEKQQQQQQQGQKRPPKQKGYKGDQQQLPQQSSKQSKEAPAAVHHGHETAGTAAAKAARLQAKVAAAAAAADSAAATAAALAAVEHVSAAAKKPWHANSGAAVSSNWQALQQQLKAQAAAKPKPLRHRQRPGADSSGSKSKPAAKKQISSIGHNTSLTPVVAMDCEMVGVGPGGDRDSLARVSVVNAAGNVLLDSYVAQKEPVSDYRTWVSGILPEHLIGAPSIEEVQQKVSELMSGRVLVGHSLNKDLKVLMLSHPRKNIRDTARYPPFMFSKGGKRRPRALRHLAQQELSLTIQEGQHSSVDDARAALYLYQKHAVDWERALKAPGGLRRLKTAQRPTTAKKKAQKSYAARNIAEDHMADL